MVSLNDLSLERRTELERMYDYCIPQSEIDAAWMADQTERYGADRANGLMYATMARKMARSVRMYRQIPGCSKNVEAALREFRTMTALRRNANRCFWSQVRSNNLRAA